AGVAIEYRLNGRAFRIDFMLSGRNLSGQESLVIIELKQWTDVALSDLSEHVRTVVGGNIRDLPHPSYQAWSYSSHLKMYNEYVYSNEVSVTACAYLHNCMDATVVNESRYEAKLREVPVFIKGQSSELRELITRNISKGTGTALLERIDSAVVRPSKQLAEAVGSMLRGQEEFVLLDEQKTVLEKIVKASKDSVTGQKRVLIINGGPGTGKSVISINALARLTGERLNAKYVTPNAAPRAVFESKLKKIFGKAEIKHLFSGSGSFTESESESFDTLIVDEAHRLRMRSGMFKNLGESQVKEIINSAHTSVFFIDEAQKVTWSDVGEILMIEEVAKEAGAFVERFELTSQFRCGGSDDYIAWLDETLGIHADVSHYFSTEKFDFQIFDSPVAMHEIIKEKNKENNKSRVVAGYCWDWISKDKPNLSDISIPEFGYKATWNLTSDGGEWIISPHSVEEVGCIHTCQGLEVDYVGVIIGPDLIARNGVLRTDPLGRAKTDKSLAGFKKEFKEDPIKAELKADELIRNTYRTLLSRGMKGCYVYFTDAETAQYFRDHLPS
ncbi:MAG: DUF2075 domain-containing protein, partial [Actinobacteria bacterium]|nr:DUF2075 domain-containing protein [Actinomycetota bacterium]